MKKSSIIWLIVIVIIIIAGYFWWSSMSSYPSSVTTTQTSTPGASNPTTNPTTNPITTQTTTGAALTLHNSGAGIFGAYLSAANGMTLYQSTKDSNNVSNCTGACATAWPPYIVSATAAASLTADPGITGRIGTIKRANGSLQVTYRGLPLYFFEGDAKPGDTKGEAVNGFTEVAP
jgi:predicted lipoprotein with Yx(FWY)xxD motif